MCADTFVYGARGVCPIPNSLVLWVANVIGFYYSGLSVSVGWTLYIRGFYYGLSVLQHGAMSS